MNDERREDTVGADIQMLFVRKALAARLSYRLVLLFDTSAYVLLCIHRTSVDTEDYIKGVRRMTAMS